MRNLITIIILFGFFKLVGQNDNFEYDDHIITKYAVTALEEYNVRSPRSAKNLERDYELDNSTSHGRFVTDCEGDKVQVIMVVFPKTNGKGSASVYLTYSKDNYFGTILNREYSIQPANEAIEDFKNSDFGDFLYGCGL